MKLHKTFRITETNNTKLKTLASHIDRSEGWILNEIMDKYFKEATWKCFDLRAINSIK